MKTIISLTNYSEHSSIYRSRCFVQFLCSPEQMLSELWTPHPLFSRINCSVAGHHPTQMMTRGSTVPVATYCTYCTEPDAAPPLHLTATQPSRPAEPGRRSTAPSAQSLSVGSQYRVCSQLKAKRLYGGKFASFFRAESRLSKE
jgi:hypothetical protein